MRIHTDPIPLHIARAYGVATPRPIPGPAPAVEARRTDIVEIGSRAGANWGASDLVAAAVARPVDFAETTPTRPTPGGALPFYQRPADVNAAVTGIMAGRTLDVTG